MAGKVFLIDGDNLLYRAFYAVPNFTTIKNQPTNAVYGFTMMLMRLLDEKDDGVIIATFDTPEKTFRHIEYKEYKVQRSETPEDLICQKPLVRDVLNAFNIPILEIPGVEADDVIGTLARKAEAEGLEAIIVTGDLDALQLVSDRVRVMVPVKGVTETILYDEAAVVERFSFKPSQLVDYKGLKGDASDNIPGVPGIGDKTAKKLIAEYGSLENLLENIPSMKESKVKSLLIEWTVQARLSKRLGTILTDVPLNIDFKACRYGGPDYTRVRDIFRKLEFRTLLRRIPEESAEMDLFSDVPAPPAPEVPINKASDVKKLLEECKTGFAFKTLGSNNGLACGLYICAAAGEVHHIDVKEGDIPQGLKALLESDCIPKFGHDMKHEYRILQEYGLKISKPVFDVMLASYVLNPTRGSHTMNEISLDYTGVDIAVSERKGFSLLDEKERAAYVEAIMRTGPVLSERLIDEGMERLFRDMEMPLVPILAEMENAGVSIDREWLGSLSEELGERLEKTQSEIYSLAGMDFNIGSPKQLQEVLFEKLGLPTGKKTKTGYSTDADTLAVLAPAHEIVSKILSYRELSKLKSTYADALPKLVNETTGKIHTSLNQAVTATGRLSSSEPNLQNIPIRTEIGREIRKAFIASPGNTLVSADYSQIELRILAHVSRDPGLIKAFENDEDIHLRTAVKIFGLPAGEINQDLRRQAKTVNFAVIYGMGDYGLSRELTIPVGLAKEYIDGYFREYPGVREYTAETLEKAREMGYVESLMGRRRYMPELSSLNRQMREFAERAAVNMPIQGTAADIVKIAMIEIDKRLKNKGRAAKMVLQVHDELVFDCPVGEAKELVPEIRAVMENAVDLDVPLKVDVKAGHDWCQALPVSVLDESVE